MKINIIACLLNFSQTAFLGQKEGGKESRITVLAKLKSENMGQKYAFIARQTKGVCKLPKKPLSYAPLLKALLL